MPKIRKETNEEYRTVFKKFKALSQCSSVTLRKELAIQYPEIWENTGNQHESDERRIKRILDVLVKFGIASKEKIGKEQIYTYIHNDNKIGKVHQIAKALNIGLDTENSESYYHRRDSIVSLLNDVSESYYIKTQQEDIGNKEKVIKELELAIEKRRRVVLTYRNNNYTVSPLKIALFDGFWYLIAYNGKYLKYRIKNIPFVEILKEAYQPKIANDLKLDEWHNIWHDPMKKHKTIKLFIDNEVFHYFQEKNILGVNTHKSRLTPCTDGMEYECHITHPWELLPTLMQWQKFVSILDQSVDDADFIESYRNILKEALEKLPS